MPKKKGDGGAGGGGEAEKKAKTADAEHPIDSSGVLNAAKDGVFPKFLKLLKSQTHLSFEDFNSLPTGRNFGVVHQIAFHGNRAALEALLTAHPRVDLKMLTKDGKTAEDVAVEEGADASFLVFLRDCLRRQNLQELVSAAQIGEWDKFRVLLASSSVMTAELNTIPIGRKWGVIHQVSYWGEAGVLQTLVADHPTLDLELETNEDVPQTPLEIAQGERHKDYCAVLQGLLNSATTSSSGGSSAGEGGERAKDQAARPAPTTGRKSTAAPKGKKPAPAKGRGRKKDSEEQESEREDTEEEAAAKPVPMKASKPPAKAASRGKKKKAEEESEQEESGREEEAAPAALKASELPAKAASGGSSLSAAQESSSTSGGAGGGDEDKGDREEVMDEVQLRNLIQDALRAEDFEAVATLSRKMSAVKAEGQLRDQVNLAAPAASPAPAGRGGGAREQAGGGSGGRGGGARGSARGAAVGGGAGKGEKTLACDDAVGDKTLEYDVAGAEKTLSYDAAGGEKTLTYDVVGGEQTPGRDAAGAEKTIEDVEEERKKEQAREREKELEKEKALERERKDKREREDAERQSREAQERERAKKEKEKEKERGKAKEKEMEENQREKEQEKKRERERKAREREREEEGKKTDTAGGASSGDKRKMMLTDQAPPMSLDLPPEGMREKTGGGAELSGKFDAGTIVSIDVVDLDKAGGFGGGTGDGTQALALPLLCAEELYGFDLSLAARCAMSTVKEFLDRHKDDAWMRIVFVEVSGSPALEALRAQCMVSDKRLVVAQSSDQASISQLGERNLPCQFVAVESEPFFHKGARPARRRARHIYDKSGKEGSPMSLGKTTSDRYNKMHGKTGDAYAVELSPTSPLRETSKCHTVIHVIVPSRNDKHKTEECYMKDDVAGAKMLKKCYSNLFDNFYQLSPKRSVTNAAAGDEHMAEKHAGEAADGSAAAGGAGETAQESNSLEF